MWDAQLRDASHFTTAANRLLVETVARRRPGSALDLLMGQGRNALHLARHGWHVTGVDRSAVAIELARRAAAAERLALTTVHADVTRCELGEARWDLVAMIYASASELLLARVQRAVARGGLFVLEYFHADSAAGGWPTGKLAALFAGFEIVRDDVVVDVADWTLRRQKLVRFVARRPNTKRAGT